MSTLPIDLKDIAVQFPPGRHPRLPPIYKTLSHPKKSGPGNVYYFIQDVTKKGMEASLKIEDEMKIPFGPKDVAIAQGRVKKPIVAHLTLKNKLQGFLELSEHDIIFVRATNASPTGEDDVPVEWVCGP
jgi:hypothetical protein